MRILHLTGALAVLAALAHPLLAAEPAPGKTVTVECEGDPAQKYSCYVPKAYSPKREWPILYCFSPNARGDAFVQRYRDVCEERGWIVVGSMNSQNGPWEPIKAAIDAMLSDAEARFSLSKRSRYASGFSGGARVSFAVAEMFPDRIAGVIAIGAGLHSGGKMPRPELAVFLTCGDKDFNKTELDALHPRLKQAGNPVLYENFPGDHTMPPVPLLEKAVRWMDDQSAEVREKRFAAGLEEARGLAEGEPAKAWLALLDLLEALPDVKEGGAEAEKLKKSLERDPAVKTEVQALKKYETARAWLEKNRARVEKSTSVRAQAVKKLRDVAERYPDTRGAGLAEQRIAELEGS